MDELDIKLKKITDEYNQFLIDTVLNYDQRRLELIMYCFEDFEEPENKWVLDSYSCEFVGGSLVIGYRDFKTLFLINASTETFSIIFDGNEIRTRLMSIGMMKKYCHLYQKHKNINSEYYQNEILGNTCMRHYIKFQKTMKEFDSILKEIKLENKYQALIGA